VDVVDRVIEVAVGEVAVLAVLVVLVAVVRLMLLVVALDVVMLAFSAPLLTVHLTMRLGAEAFATEVLATKVAAAEMTAAAGVAVRRPAQGDNRGAQEKRSRRIANHDVPLRNASSLAPGTPAHEHCGPPYRGSLGALQLPGGTGNNGFTQCLNVGQLSKRVGQI
jgi:hypothetical protein